jgi:23S rRNA (cytosine1962-C5)-methyltransferase
MSQRICPTAWKDYELIDAGGFEKLERFGKWILRRPEPQAIWDKSLDEREWQKLAHASFVKAAGADAEKGQWYLKPGMADRWWIQYQQGGLLLKFRLALTSFKHVGLFPEQAANWDWIYEKVKSFPKGEKPRVLNLFAYTGGASLAACAAGADVTHVDSVKQVVSWSRENMEESGLNGIRWVVEDAFKFVQREVRRGKTYHGILLDPPAYGRGPDGEKWLLEKQLNELMQMCGQILEPNGFMLLNLYSMGFSAMVAENLVTKHVSCQGVKSMNSGELFLKDQAGNALPLGTFVRL